MVWMRLSLFYIMVWVRLSLFRMMVWMSCSSSIEWFG